MAGEFDAAIPQVRKSRIAHINRQVPPLAHTPMYNWHKFWSRKTWNVVAEYIKVYCPAGGIVFDPFAGSGVVAMEALKHKRRAIICDILPVATEIARLTIKPVSLIKLRQSYTRVEKKVRDKILELYRTKCRACGHVFPMTCAVWTQRRDSADVLIVRNCIDIRYAACPRCGDRREHDTPPVDFDKQVVRKIDRIDVKEWYPRQRLYHVNGKPFLKKEKYESLDELFTKRNLQALAWLMAAIEEEPNRDLRDFLKIGFTSIVHLCASMCPVRPTRPFSSAWTEHSYWFAPEFMEQNVWEKFEGSIVGKQGLLAAKKESNHYYDGVIIAKSHRAVIEKKADIYIHTGSSLELMADMLKQYGEGGCVDYIFTDPPYDASVQYGELGFLWVAWLKRDEGYLERIASDEVIRNQNQDKDFSVYHSLLSRSFSDMYGLLKPDAYLTVTFHNPTFKVRNATIRAGVYAGFEFEKIHHQELARPSAKSLLQPFGSARGDFYLRFHKLLVDEQAIRPREIDEVRFENIVVETTKRVMAERGEPTPYTIIINTIDPELARLGFFSELNTGLNIETVLSSHIGREFALVDAHLGGAGGKLWWFRDPTVVTRLQSVPLSERVEQTVLRKLQQRGRVTFTEMWDAVSSEFPNSLTSDSMSITEALEAYARRVTGGYWLLKPGLKSGEIVRDHSFVIAMLAEIGKAWGFKIYIGKIEQQHAIDMLSKKGGKLGDYVTYKALKRLGNVQNLDVIDDIDVLWIKRDRVAALFEVESTTSMTSGLQRGSNVDRAVPKYLVLPEGREGQLRKKLKSPMFAERFEDDNWRVVYFEALREAFSREKRRGIEIEKLVDKKGVARGVTVRDDQKRLL